jgi:hypothetical protein
MLTLDAELNRLEAMRGLLDLLVTEYIEALCHGGPLDQNKQYMTIPQLQFWLDQRIARLREDIARLERAFLSACPGA